MIGMFTKEDIKKQLSVPKNTAVLMHTSLKAIGETEGRAEGLLEALIEYITEDDGLFLVPTHTWANLKYPDEITMDVNSCETCIGVSHDTDKPLTDFGRTVVERCFDLHIIPDVSHASRAVTAEVLQMAKAHGNPIVATHANAFSVHPHTRNLTDGEFRSIADCGGIVGISLCPEHLTAGNCGIESVADHIRHYIRLGGEEAVCLGCDFDGIGETPDGLSDVSCLIRLADHLNTAGIPSRVIDKLFFDNAYGFAVENFQ